MTARSSFLNRLPFVLALLAGCSDGGPLDPAAGRPVASVVVAPADLALEVGATAGLTATPLDADGTPLSGQAVVWTSADGAVATVSSAGLVSARGAGVVVIRASSAGKSGTVTVTVRARTTGEQPAVAWIQITPAGGTIPQAIGTSRQLGVVARAADGSEIVGRAVAWASSVPSVASVSATGLLQAHAAGSAWIKAEVDGRRDSVLVSVPSLIARIETDPAELSLVVGDARAIAATALDAAGRPLVRTFMWSSGNGAVATVDADGRVAARGAGTTLITVTSEGKSATIRVRVVGQLWRLTDAAGSPLPETLYRTTVTVNGAPREARFQVSEGSLRLSGDRYELRLTGWLLVDGEAPARAEETSFGVVAYDVFTGGPRLFEGDEWQNREPRFRGRFRDDGSIELDWNREAGAATVPLGFAM